MSMLIFFLILVTVGLNAAAQLLLKQGMETIGEFAFNISNVWPITVKVLLNAYVMGGLFIYLVSVVTWLMVLSRAEVSLAYPVTSLGYVITAIAAAFLLHEQISIMRILGIVVIMTGVYLVTRS